VTAARSVAAVVVVAVVVVGTLPDGYLKLNSLPQVPTKQSAPTSKICLPPYLGLPIAIPMLHRIVGPAIAKAQIPW
jgi:hypothetical protein